MKTQHPITALTAFLARNHQAIAGSVQPLTEGLVSQAFSYEANDGKYVCRLAPDGKGFWADQFACTHFGQYLPIPIVTHIGSYDADTYYCISAFIEGTPAPVLSVTEMSAYLPEVQRTLGILHRIDISSSVGYGQINTVTGNAGNHTWKQKLAKIDTYGLAAFKATAAKLSLDSNLIDKFFYQYQSNLQYASETRRLLHGDLGFGNMLLRNGRVAALIDWELMTYGDWMFDFARLSFRQAGRYGDAASFAQLYGLESENIAGRTALYWAASALWAVEFANAAKNNSVTQWLHDNLESKVLVS